MGVAEDEIRIIYKDEELVAVYKPAGLFVHRSRLGRAKRYLVQELRDQLGQFVYPCHRLDRPTAGLMLFALTAEVASYVGALLRERACLKSYQAVVRGMPTHAGELNGILRDPSGREREAHARFRLLGRGELAVPIGRFASARYALLELQPQTGRRHQLRRQLHRASHPILGDTVYGDGRHNRMSREYLACDRLLLWATGLRFRHPNGKLLALSAAPDPELVRICKFFGWLDFLTEDAWQFQEETLVDESCAQSLPNGPLLWL